MKIKISKSQWEAAGKKAGWTKESQVPLNYNGISDGGAPYTEDEMDLMAKDNESRRRSVKVTFNDGDSLVTEINGTKQEVQDYYLKNNFVKQDEKTMHHGIKVEFLN